MKHQVTKTYVTIILMIYLLAYISNIYWGKDKIFTAIFYGLIFILTWLIVRNKNTAQYAMFTNSKLNFVYHILYLTTIICLSIINIYPNAANNLTFLAILIFAISLIIKFILDTVIYFVYRNDYNNAIIEHEDESTNNKHHIITTKNKKQQDNTETSTTIKETNYTKEIIYAIILGIIIGIIRNFT